MQKGREEGIQKGREEGIQKGREEGIQKGREDGLRAVVLKLVTLKFGPPSDAVRLRIDEASAEELEAWAAGILTATSIEEFFH